MANLPSTEIRKVSYARRFSRCRAEFSANSDSIDFSLDKVTKEVQQANAGGLGGNRCRSVRVRLGFERKKAQMSVQPLVQEYKPYQKLAHRCMVKFARATTQQVFV